MKKSIIISIFLVISWASICEGAAPGMHIYLAQRFLACIKVSPDLTKPLFVGTVWPDIRYLKGVARHETHEKNVSLQSLKKVNANNAFDIGKKLHAYVDEVREKFAVKYGAYRLISDVPKGQQSAFLKFVEDEIIWEKLNKNDILTALQTTYKQEEANEKISKVGVLTWHGCLLYYFQQKPSQIGEKKGPFLNKFFPMPLQEMDHWCTQIREKSQDPKMQKYVEDLLSHFEEKFKLL